MKSETITSLSFDQDSSPSIINDWYHRVNEPLQSFANRKEGSLMKIRLDRRHVSLAIVAFILFLAITYWSAIAKVIGKVFSAAMPLLIGAVIAYIVNLLLKQYEWLFAKIFHGQRSQRFKRLFGIVMSYLTIFLIIILVIRLLIPELVSCVKLLFSTHSKTITKILAYFQQHGNLKGLWTNINLKHFNWNKVGKYITYGFSGTLKTVMSTASSIVSGITTTVIAFFFSVYLLAFKDKLAHQCQLLLDTYCQRIKKPLLHVVKAFDQSYSHYIVGQCKDAVILGCACFLGMKILQLPYASMIGVVTCFTALIPIIGAILGASVGIILIFAVSPIKAFIFLIFIILLQQLDNRVTYPLVVGQSIGLPSVWVFAAVIVGGGFSGILGMMLTVPLFAAIYKLIAEDVQRRNKHAAATATKS